MKTKSLLVILSLIVVGLIVWLIIKKESGSGSGNETVEQTETQQSNNNETLNISIFLDLSDRLERKNMNPTQMYRDTAIVNYIVKKFKAKCFALGPDLLKSENRLRVLFYPTPQSKEVVILADQLDVNLSQFKAGDKKKALHAMGENFSNSLALIYKQTIADKNWIGCDIWGFFDKKKVDVQCLRKDCRNILIILTDGYLYHEDTAINHDKAYQYLLPKMLDIPGAYLAANRNGLEDLEVLMLEVNPYNEKERGLMLPILEKWFKDMGVQKFVVSETDIPNYTRTVIDSFLN